MEAPRLSPASVCLTLKDGARFGTARAFLHPATTRPNLTVTTHALAVRLLIERGRAVGVEYLRLGRLETAHAAGEIVVASGSINSPQLLLLSGIGPADELRAAGVTPVHDLPGVGKSLQDHLNVMITFHAREKIGLGGLSQTDIAAAAVEWVATQTGPMSSNWAAAGGFARSGTDVAEPDLQLYGVISGNRDHGRYIAARPGITLHGTLQRPLSQGEIRLRSADPLQHPAIDPRYLSDPDGKDLATLVAGVRLNRRIAAAASLAGLLEGEITPSAGCATEAEIAAYIRAHCTTLYHPTSTCRMGSDAQAVVDSTLRVHGIAGLRVADASVMPRMVSGNTNAPTIMIAERAAEFMLESQG